MEMLMAGAVGFLVALALIGVTRRSGVSASASPRLDRMSAKLLRLMEHLGVQPPKPSISPAVLEAWESGDRERAVEAYTRTTGVDRADATRRLGRVFGSAAVLERNLDALLSAHGVSGEVEEQIPPGVREAYVAGSKIQAIKLYREATGTDLKEAKETVDELADINGW